MQCFSIQCYMRLFNARLKTDVLPVCRLVTDVNNTAMKKRKKEEQPEKNMISNEICDRRHVTGRNKCVGDSWPETLINTVVSVVGKCSNNIDNIFSFSLCECCVMFFSWNVYVHFILCENVIKHSFNCKCCIIFIHQKVPAGTIWKLFMKELT